MPSAPIRIALCTARFIARRNEMRCASCAAMLSATSCASISGRLISSTLIPTSLPVSCWSSFLSSSTAWPFLPITTPGRPVWMVTTTFPGFRSMVRSAIAAPPRRALRYLRRSASSLISAGKSFSLANLAPGGGTLTTAAVRGAITVRQADTRASAAVAGDVALGRVLVYGRAGWESKFVIAALEEQGWLVDARLRVGGDVQVTQGAVRVPDIARHAAVVVLDTAVGAEAAAIVRFVRAGGGLVMAGEGAGARALAVLAPARVVRVEPPETRAFEGHEPLHALPLHVLGALRDDAVPLGEREGAPAVAARRVGAGRVVQMGHADTWRWRMQAEEGGVREHRAFWSRLVGTVAGATGVPAAVAGLDPAPLALTLHALGPASAAPPRPHSRGPALPFRLAPLLLALLVAEWASRRTRGVP
jgi:hypothetical protein